MTSYRIRDVQRMLALSRGTIAAFVRHGFVKPRRGPRNAYLFSFDDLVALRAARDLLRANVSPSRIAASLRRLRAGLPRDVPASGLRVSAQGDRIVVRAGDGPWQGDRGQYLLDFSVSLQGGLAQFDRSAGPHAPDDPASPSVHAAAARRDADAEAAHSFESGYEAETRDPEHAQRHYRRALALQPAHAGACANLGRLLHEAARLDEALAVYRAGLAAGIDDALVHFNLAVLLQDLGDGPAAGAHYEAALRLQRDFADCHYNLALLCESLGERQKALRHMHAYRRLARPGSR